VQRGIAARLAGWRGPSWIAAWGALRFGLRTVVDRLLAPRRPRLCLLALCLALFLPGLAAIQPLDLEEIWIAVVTRQMLDAGDLLHVPPLAPEGDGGSLAIHWVQAVSVRALEALRLAHRSGIFAYRLPAFAGAVLAVLALHHWGRALVGRRTAFLGAAMLAGSAAVVAAAHLATADAAALAFGVACMGLLGAAYLRPAGFNAWQALGFWVCMAAGVRLLGPAAMAPPLLGAMGLVVADRGAPWLRSLRPGWGLPLLAAMLLPWETGVAGVVRIQAPALSLHRTMGGVPIVPGMHALAFAATAFPATWIVLLSLPDAWRRRTRPAMRFLLAWAIAAWSACEAGAFPPGSAAALPPLVLIGACWATDPLRSRPPRRLFLTAAALLAAAAAAVGLGALAVAVLDIREAPFGLLATGFSGLLVWRLLVHAASGAWARAALVGTLLAAPAYAAVLQGTFCHLLIGRAAARLAGTAERVAPGLPPADFGIVGFSRASLLFAHGPGTRLLADGAEAARFLAGGPGRVVGVIDAEERGFHHEAAALSLPVREETQSMIFDYLRPGFAAVLFFRAGPPEGP
jgi:hypothetical protein